MPSRFSRAARASCADAALHPPVVCVPCQGQAKIRAALPQVHGAAASASRGHASAGARTPDCSTPSLSAADAAALKLQSTQRMAHQRRQYGMSWQKRKKKPSSPSWPRCRRNCRPRSQHGSMQRKSRNACEQSAHLAQEPSQRHCQQRGVRRCMRRRGLTDWRKLVRALAGAAPRACLATWVNTGQPTSSIEETSAMLSGHLDQT